MGQTLTHGVYLPDEGERNCYDGLAANWQILDTAVGTVAEHTTQIAGKAPAVHTHTKADITDFPAYGTTAGTICEGNDSRLSDARTPVSHTHTKSDVTDLLNSNFIPSSDVNYTLGSSDLRWKQIWAGGYKAKPTNIDFTDSTTTGSKQSWWVDTLEKNGTSFFGIGSIRTHSLGLNEEHFRIKNAGGKWADLYIQLGDNNQFIIGTAAHSDVTNNGFRGKFTPLDSFIPNANNSYDLGSSSYQWNNLYAKKTYTDTVKPVTGSITIQSNGTDKNIGIYNGDSATDGGGFWAYGKDHSNGSLCRIQIYNTSKSRYERVDLVNSQFLPVPSGEIDLGTSTAKWKSFNGINPGALSLPSGGTTENTDWYNVAGDILPTGGNATDFNWGSNYFTPVKDGWLAITVKQCSAISIWCSSLKYGTSLAAPDASLNRQLIVPVVANKAYEIRITGNSWSSARLIMPKGNV